MKHTARVCCKVYKQMFLMERLTAEANTNKLIPAIGEDKESYC